MGKLKYGIIGLGGIAEKHLKGYIQLSERVEIVACCDFQKERLNEMADKYNIPNRYTDYKELLEHPGLDFVSVCLPNYLHAKVSIEAMKAGLHVHCEKPAATSPSEVEEMIKTRDETGKILMIGLNNRFTSKSQYVKKYVDSGALGDIYFVKCGWLRRSGLPHSGWFTDKKKSGGGPLIDLGVHYLDLVMYFMGYPKVAGTFANTYTQFGNSLDRLCYTYPGATKAAEGIYDVEDLASGTIRLENGTNIQFEFSWASNIEHEKTFYELYGSKAGVRYYNDFNGEEKVQIFRLEGGQQVDIMPDINPYLYPLTEFGDFVASIEENRNPQVVKMEECLTMSRILDGIYKSAESGKLYSFD